MPPLRLGPLVYTFTFRTLHLVSGVRKLSCQFGFSRFSIIFTLCTRLSPRHRPCGSTPVIPHHRQSLIETARNANMEYININYGGQDSQSRASSIIPANYDDLQDQLQAALTRIAVLEGNLEEERQVR